MSAQNLTLLTDLYELTMMQGYFETQENQTVIFDVFFRENPNKGGYSIMEVVADGEVGFCSSLGHFGP